MTDAGRERTAALGTVPGRRARALQAVDWDAAAIPSAPEAGAGHEAVLRAIAEEGGLRSVRIVAWRDLDDPEAGGSELHAHRIASLWAGAGLDVELRTSAVDGATRVVERDGYLAVRRSGRYGVFARAGLEHVARGSVPGQGLVEIWNGMPFLSPLWFRGPRLVFLHHVHAEMWRMVLPRWMARMGETVERRLAPPLYRSTRVVTLSESSRAEIVELIGLDPARVTVVPPGVEPRFSPAPSGPASARSPEPLVVAVGRLVPVKRFDLLLRALERVKASVPALRAVVVGEGYDRSRLESLRRDLGATSWVSFAGRVPSAELVDWYRRAWLVASSSLREGWGMTLTEAGACGTPAVASDIAGHRDAVVHGVTGLLAGGETELAGAVARVLADPRLRARLGAGAIAHAARFSWGSAARATLQALAEEACFVAGAARAELPLVAAAP